MGNRRSLFLVIASVLTMLGVVKTTLAQPTISYPKTRHARMDTDEAGFKGKFLVDITHPQFGAIPNDGLDDHAAIQAALDFANNDCVGGFCEVGGEACSNNDQCRDGAVHIPTGNFIINDTLWLGNNAQGSESAVEWFYGNGQGSAIECHATGKPCIEVSGSHHKVLENFWVIGDCTDIPSIGLMLARTCTCGADNICALPDTDGPGGVTGLDGSAAVDDVCSASAGIAASQAMYTRILVSGCFDVAGGANYHTEANLFTHTLFQITGGNGTTAFKTVRGIRDQLVTKGNIFYDGSHNDNTFLRSSFWHHKDTIGPLDSCLEIDGATTVGVYASLFDFKANPTDFCTTGTCSTTTTQRCNVNGDCPPSETCVANSNHLCSHSGEPCGECSNDPSITCDADGDCGAGTCEPKTPATQIDDCNGAIPMVRITGKNTDPRGLDFEGNLFHGLGTYSTPALAVLFDTDECENDFTCEYTGTCSTTTTQSCTMDYFKDCPAWESCCPIGETCNFGTAPCGQCSTDRCSESSPFQCANDSSPCGECSDSGSPCDENADCNFDETCIRQPDSCTVCNENSDCPASGTCELRILSSGLGNPNSLCVMTSSFQNQSIEDNFYSKSDAYVRADPGATLNRAKIEAPRIIQEGLGSDCINHCEYRVFADDICSVSGEPLDCTRSGKICGFCDDWCSRTDENHFCIVDTTRPCGVCSNDGSACSQDSQCGAGTCSPPTSDPDSLCEIACDQNTDCTATVGNADCIVGRCVDQCALVKPYRCLSDIRGTCSVTTSTICSLHTDCPQGTCSITTATACNVEGDCPAGETCVGGQSCDLSPCGECSVTTATKCDEDNDCPRGNCSVTTATTCRTDADCPPAETCEGEETCVAMNPPDQLCQQSCELEGDCAAAVCSTDIDNAPCDWGVSLGRMFEGEIYHNEGGVIWDNRADVIADIKKRDQGQKQMINTFFESIPIARNWHRFTPEGAVHAVDTGTSGNVTANSSANQIIAECRGKSCGMSILTEDAAFANIFTGTPSRGNDFNRIQFIHPSEQMNLTVADNLVLTVQSVDGGDNRFNFLEDIWIDAPSGAQGQTFSDIRLRGNTGATDDVIGSIYFENKLPNPDVDVALIQSVLDGTPDDAGKIQFWTRPTGGSLTNRLTIGNGLTVSINDMEIDQSAGIASTLTMKGNRTGGDGPFSILDFWNEAGTTPSVKARIRASRNTDDDSSILQFWTQETDGGGLIKGLVVGQQGDVFVPQQIHIGGGENSTAGTGHGCIGWSGSLLFSDRDCSGTAPLISGREGYLGAIQISEEAAPKLPSTFDLDFGPGFDIVASGGPPEYKANITYDYSQNKVNLGSIFGHVTGRLPLDNLTDDDLFADRCLVSGGPSPGEPNWAVCPGGGGGGTTNQVGDCTVATCFNGVDATQGTYLRIWDESPGSNYGELQMPDLASNVVHTFPLTGRCSSTVQSCSVDADCPGVETCGGALTSVTIPGIEAPNIFTSVNNVFYDMLTIDGTKGATIQGDLDLAGTRASGNTQFFEINFDNTVAGGGNNDAIIQAARYTDNEGTQFRLWTNVPTTGAVFEVLRMNNEYTAIGAPIFGIGDANTFPTNATCIGIESDRLFGDLNCDGVRSGEEFLDNAPTGGSITVREVDLTPSHTGTTILEFDQADGFQVSQPVAGTARIDFTGGGNGNYGQLYDGETAIIDWVGETAFEELFDDADASGIVWHPGVNRYFIADNNQGIRSMQYGDVCPTSQPFRCPVSTNQCGYCQDSPPGPTATECVQNSDCTGIGTETCIREPDYCAELFEVAGTDYEGITITHPDSDFVYVLDEATPSVDPTIVEFDVDNLLDCANYPAGCNGNDGCASASCNVSGTGRVWNIATCGLPRENSNNLGVEGLTFIPDPRDPEGGVFLVGDQQQGEITVIRLNILTGTAGTESCTQLTGPPWNSPWENRGIPVCRGGANNGDPCTQDGPLGECASEICGANLTGLEWDSDNELVWWQYNQSTDHIFVTDIYNNLVLAMNQPAGIGSSIEGIGIGPADMVTMTGDNGPVRRLGFPLGRMHGRDDLPDEQLLQSKSVTIDSATATEDITLWYTRQPLTVHELSCVRVGGTDATFQIKWHADRNNAGNQVESVSCTSTTTGTHDQAMSGGADIAANSWIWLETSAPTTGSPQLHVTIRYGADRTN